MWKRLAEVVRRWLVAERTLVPPDGAAAALTFSSAARASSGAIFCCFLSDGACSLFETFLSFYSFLSRSGERMGAAAAFLLLQLQIFS